MTTILSISFSLFLSLPWRNDIISLSSTPDNKIKIDNKNRRLINLWCSSRAWEISNNAQKARDEYQVCINYLHASEVLTTGKMSDNHVNAAIFADCFKIVIDITATESSEFGLVRNNKSMAANMATNKLLADNQKKRLSRHHCTHHLLHCICTRGIHICLNQRT